MKEERIIFQCPRKIALIGLSPIPRQGGIIQMNGDCRGWQWQINYPPLSTKIEAILGEAMEGERYPFVSKDVEGCEVELIVRQ